MLNHPSKAEVPGAQKNLHFRKKMRKAVAWLVIFAVGFAAGGFLCGRGQVPEDGRPDNTAPGALELNEELTALQTLIQEQFLFPIDQETLETGMLRGLVDGLGDPYATYFTPADLEVLNREMGGEFCGIGANLRQEDDGEIIVESVFADSPARQAGLKAGDVILEVDGVSTQGFAMKDLISQHILGKPGTKVSIQVQRPQVKEPILLTVTRALIQVQTVEAQMLQGNTGYIRVQDFAETTGDEFIKQCSRLEEQGLERLILDLRNNPGGSLSAVVQMLDYILPDEESRFSRTLGKSTIVYTQSKSGDSTTYLANDGHALTVPIKILVNQSSASASEILAGCLRDYGYGELAGEKTFGKGSVQSLFKLSGDCAVKFTVAQYYLPSGFALNGVGLPVDVELPNMDLSKLGGNPAEDPSVKQVLALFDRKPALKPLAYGKNAEIAAPDSLLKTVPNKFICKEPHMKMPLQRVEQELSAFCQAASLRIQLREDNWFGKSGVGEEFPAYSHDVWFAFERNAEGEEPYLLLSYDIEGDNLHSMECDLLNLRESAELMVEILECTGVPLSKKERAAVWDAIEQGKAYTLHGKHYTLEVPAAEGGTYIEVKAL